MVTPRPLRWASLRSAVIIAATWLLGLLPFIWPLSSVGGATIADWYERQVYHATALIDFGLNAAGSINRYNVLYVTLEVAAKIIAAAATTMASSATTTGASSVSSTAKSTTIETAPT